MLVLSIETSCDETAAAVVEAPPGPPSPDWRPKILGEVISTQVEMHARFGGVVPELASRAHTEAVLPAVRSAMEQAGARPEDLDFIAATRGPGLIGALLVGVETAKALSFAWRKPLLPVHHLAGHVLAAYLAEPRPAFPFLCLLVSGGHSAFYEVRGPESFSLLGRTRDDAAGEAFDKGARMLGLGYPGGVALERAAVGGDSAAHRFPVAMRHSGDLDLSFSGLKTALRLHLKDEEGQVRPPPTSGLADVCASYQEAVVQTLAGKAATAIERTGAERLVVAGGVAANRRLRGTLERVASERGAEIFLVPLRFCTDNAVMIAVAALAAPTARWLSPGSPEALSLDAHAAPPLDAPFAAGALP
jgi:N6-L-threonylcarbamoyladenine synthase